MHLEWTEDFDQDLPKDRFRDRVEAKFSELERLAKQAKQEMECWKPKNRISRFLDEGK